MFGSKDCAVCLALALVCSLLLVSLERSPQGDDMSHVYWPITAPPSRARIQRFNLFTRVVEDICWSSSLERRGAVPVVPTTLAVYPLPKACSTIAMHGPRLGRVSELLL